jgi:hypothetical protein
MWLDYVLYLSTGLVLIAVVALIVILIRNRAGLGIQLIFVALLLIGLVAASLLRPELFRERNEDLVVTEGEAGPQTEVELIGFCLSIFRQIGPLSFIMGNDFFPGGDWSQGPVNGCDASGHAGVVNLPDTVRSGDWMLCDYANCHQLVPG